MSKICPRCSELLPDEAGFCPFDGAELTKTSDKFLGKTIAARYRLTKKLGSGGMSVVYLARHELISRLSAIKILRPELARIAEHRERFLREARAVNRINHENIVEISDVGESDGIAYLVMEYVEGESLLGLVQRGPLRWERAVRIAIQVASALARTHQTGIIHRDLKPENILLVPNEYPRLPNALGPDQRGQTPELVKLTDFGIAKMMGEPSLTMNEQLFGTPGYIAPENVNGLPIDGRADIYSLAVVLYEMLTSRLPFEGRGQSDLLLKPLTTLPIPPSKRVQGLPPDLEALILQCLSRDPDGRPRDAFALHDSLVDLLMRLGTSSIAPGPYVEDAGPAEPREPLETIFDRESMPALPEEPLAEARLEGGPTTTESMSSRWSTALIELETQIARARRMGGDAAIVAGRAAELAMVAGEMIPRIERATKLVKDLQAKVDWLEGVGREFRANLGHAIDVLVHDRSRELAHLDTLRARRETLEHGVNTARSANPSGSRSWENVALVDEEHHSESVIADLTFQIQALQTQLDAKNEEHESSVVRVAGSLEGSLSALRRLTYEIARTIDDGIDMVTGR